MGQLNVFTLIGGLVLLLLIGLFFIQSSRIGLLSRRLDRLTMGAEDQSLEDVLGSHLETVVRVARDLEEVAARTAVLEGVARLHFSRLGLVRFNPFDDTGGNQSFAMAMLDANNDGFVISSLHSRTGTRLYAKAIFEGTCESPLSTEEEKAVGIAVAQGGSAAATGAQQAAPTPVPATREPARQRAGATSGTASTASLAKPAPAPKAGRKAGTAPASKAQAPSAAEAQPAAGEAGTEAPQA